MNDFDRAVVITMVAVLVVQATIDDVVDVVAVWYGFVATTCAVNVVATSVGLVAFGRVGCVYVKAVFVIMTLMFVMEVAIVQVVDVVAVANGGVATIFAMNVVVVFVCGAVAHDFAFRVWVG